MITKFSKFKVKDKQDKKDLPEVKNVNDIKKDTLKRLRDINKDVIKVDESADVESVFKVRVDVPKDLIKEYIDKVKAEEGKNPLELWSGKDIADEVGKYIMSNYLKIDNIPTAVIFGDTGLRDEVEDRFEQEGDIESTDDIDVVDKEDTAVADETTEEDFTEDVDKTDEIEVEEEEMFGMSENLTDNDIKFIKK